MDGEKRKIWNWKGEGRLAGGEFGKEKQEREREEGTDLEEGMVMVRDDTVYRRTGMGREPLNGMHTRRVFVLLKNRERSDRIIHELVAPQVSLESSDIEAVRPVQTVEARDLDGEADFVAGVFGVLAVGDGVWAGGGGEEDDVGGG